ncbi:MAG: type II toxin-antitoxin system RelE/ParE family toxin [Alphaproteobacteria bacterium]|nr:type II toxin-antitoxin system RelE/ParE family toxin [Alphaproteobacteria bacterium]MBN9557603.1 type II toxin-antitoxin system RelE/ParE family toxin [Alphaproteobacteria bacterium]
MPQKKHTKGQKNDTPLPKPQKSSAWTIELTETALDDLEYLSRTDRNRVLDFLFGRLQTWSNPRQTGHSLSGSLSGYWRYRVGDYRILCRIEDVRVVVVVVKVGHRREVYR